MKKRVVVAMSGGVDSSVAAALLQRKGHEVIGITMRFGISGRKQGQPCCANPTAIEDAKKVARALGITHHVVNMHALLEARVIREFCAAYIRGRTPNPCVRCNQYIKFGALLKKALSFGASYLATGHYARIASSQLSARSFQYRLMKAKDKKKDQSYFLYRLNQDQLRHILFPLGGLTKLEVRRLAHNFKLPVAEKKASQEICFLAGTDYRDFLKQRVARSMRPGLIVDSKGALLGEHKGIAFYTIGQREGLGIAGGYPLYINALDARKNLITIGPKEEVYKKACVVIEPHFINPCKEKKIAVKVRIRYNHKEAPALLERFALKALVTFKEPQFAITRGQSAVFYDKDTVLGGGIIDEAVG